MKHRQQVSRNAFGGVRVIGRKMVDGQSVPFDTTTTDPDVLAAADLLDAAVDAALELDGGDPSYVPPAPEPVVEAPAPPAEEPAAEEDA